MGENQGKDLAVDMKRDEELLEKIKGIEDRIKEEGQILWRCKPTIRKKYIKSINCRNYSKIFRW